jgi:hypothetical protein
MAQPDTIKPIPLRTVEFDPFPTVKIAYLRFAGWVALRDPNNTHTSQWQNEQYHQASLAHLNDITNLLKPIPNSTIGKAVLSEFNVYPDNSTFILPWEFVPPKKQVDTAGLTVTPIGANPFLGSVVCEADRKGPYKCVLSAGKGTISYIFLSSANAASNGITASEVLVHELVHAGRISRGVFNERPMRGEDPRDAPNTEDFLANLVENMYRMAVRNGPFARYYGGDVDTNSYLTSGSHPGPRDVLSLFRMGQSSLYNTLMHSHTRYNPIAQYEGEIRAQRDYPKAHLTQSA